MQVNPKYAHKGITIRLKVDEMWSFVGSKQRPRWLWWVEDHDTGEVVAFVFGRRTHATFRRLLALLKAAQIQVSGWITDAWWAYFDCLDQALRVESKALLQSLERKHLTLRTRLKRLTRRTVCFSKSVVVHDTLIGLFINHYFFAHQRV
ncbi:MAG TPA: IS1 family transposase [Spirosoma sp.]|nr:IS1 family transposase [Spirosoma sp.]